MEHIAISIPEELLEQFRLVAAERRTPIESLFREALEEKARGFRPRPQSLGIAASGHSDTARRVADERPELRNLR